MTQTAVTGICLSVLGIGMMVASIRQYGHIMSVYSIWSIGWLFPTAVGVWPVPGFPVIENHTLQVIWLATLSFLIGLVLVSMLYPPNRVLSRVGVLSRMPGTAKLDIVRWSARCIVVVGIVSLFITYYRIGGIPVLAGAEIETLRRILREEVTYNVYNISKVGIILLLVAALVNRHQKKSHRHWADGVLVVIYVVGTVLTGWRNDVVVVGALSLGILATESQFYWRSNAALVIIGSVVGVLVVFYIGGLARTMALNRASFTSMSAYEQVLSDWRFWVKPLYYVKPNYINLGYVVEHAFGEVGGRLSFQYLEYLPGFGGSEAYSGRAYSDVRVLSTVSERSYNVVTYLGRPFLDFGNVGVLLSSLVMGSGAGLTYNHLTRSSQPSLTVLVGWATVAMLVLLMPIGFLLSTAGVFIWVVIVAVIEVVVVPVVLGAVGVGGTQRS